MKTLIVLIVTLAFSSAQAWQAGDYQKKYGNNSGYSQTNDYQRQKRQAEQQRRYEQNQWQQNNTLHDIKVQQEQYNFNRNNRF